MKASIYSLLLALTAFTFSCTDHEVPTEKVYPVVTTPEYEFISEDDPNLILHVYIESMGNQPITEYGVVFSLEDVNSNDLPTLSDIKFVFSEPVGPGLKNRLTLQDDLPYAPGTYKRVYRAYAVTSDGTIVYGNAHSGVFSPL